MRKSGAFQRVSEIKNGTKWRIWQKYDNSHEVDTFQIVLVTKY